MTRLERQIDDDHVGMEGFDQTHGAGHVGRFAAHLQVGLVGNQLRHATPDQRMIIDNHDPPLAEVQMVLIDERHRGASPE